MKSQNTVTQNDTLDQLAKADVAKQALALLSRYGVKNIAELKPDQYGAFALELRALAEREQNGEGNKQEPISKMLADHFIIEIELAGFVERLGLFYEKLSGLEAAGVEGLPIDALLTIRHDLVRFMMTFAERVTGYRKEYDSLKGRG